MKTTTSAIGKVKDVLSALENSMVHLPSFNETLTTDFKKNVFTWKEVAFCESCQDSIIKYAMTFAAKDAILKALSQINDKLVIPLNKINIQIDKLAGSIRAEFNLPGYQLYSQLSINSEGDYIYATAELKSLWDY